MEDLERLLSEVADFVEILLRQSPKAEAQLMMARAQGMEPNVLRLDVAPKTALLVRFQDIPE